MVSLARVLDLSHCRQLLIVDELVVEDVVDCVGGLDHNFSFLPESVNLQIDSGCAMSTLTWTKAVAIACSAFLVRQVVSPAIASLIGGEEVPEHGDEASHRWRENQSVSPRHHVVA